MLDRVLYVPMFVVTELLYGFRKTIWDTTKSVEIKRYVNSYFKETFTETLAVLRVKKRQMFRYYVIRVTIVIPTTWFKQHNTYS